MYRYSSFNVEFYNFVVSICRRKKEYLYIVVTSRFIPSVVFYGLVVSIFTPSIVQGRENRSIFISD